MKTWVKLYTEINRDPKMAELTWAQRGIWAGLLALAGELDLRNGDGSENGQLDTLENTAWRIRCELPELTEALAVFTARGMIETINGVLTITHYANRQARPPSTRPAAVRERVAKHRSRRRHEACTMRNNEVTRVKRPVTLSESESETDTDTESDQNQTQNMTEAQRAVANRTGFKHISDPDLISSHSLSDSDLTLTDAARIERGIQIRERAERRKLPGREEAQMRQWANEYGAAVLYEATRRTAHNKPDNFGGYLRKTLEEIGKAREPP